MSEDYEDIIEENIIDEEIDEDIVDDKSEGKFGKLLESDAKKYKLSGMFKDWYLDYASYVILHRAVPHIIDGLKPVQRRVLHAMYKVDTGSFTKVATLVGEAMKYHPHGDASILGAMVQLGQKGFAIDCQGNWGNILTGDANAAMRYIEASHLRLPHHELDEQLRRKESGAYGTSGTIPAPACTGYGRYRCGYVLEDSSS